ncbi:MAG: segregation/condensation protein A [Clostridiaceae bacterium]|nr:segregation/condensation protein A [Clostridiaceae bacterium]
MESALSKACTIKIQNFEGPFDLLYHLIEKNQFDIYDIPINEIADQYLDYLFEMQELDLEIASEFLVLASTLLHIKSKLLLPNPKENKEDEIDPREELILRLVEYKKYKKFTEILKNREKEWDKVFYKYPEEIDIKADEVPLELSVDELRQVYLAILDRNDRKLNKNTGKMTHILQHEKVSLKSKIREVVRTLLNKAYFRFSELFPMKTKSKLEIVTGLLAVLELTKLKKVTILQPKQFSEITVYKCEGDLEDLEGIEDIDDEKIAAENSSAV